MKNIDEFSFPRGFLAEYRKNITLRCLGSLVVLALAGLLCTAIDFSSLKYPNMGVFFVVAVAFFADVLVFGLHRILFQSSWSGEITKIEAGYKTKTRNRGFERRMIVTVEIRKDSGKTYTAELYRECDKNTAKNAFQIYAPYKVADRVVYLRGMKFFARYGVENKEELSFPLFVCPYCGEINTAEREKCYSCGKILLK